MVNLVGKMAPSSKHVLSGKAKSTYLQCNGDKCMKKALKITQERYQEKVVTEELEELQNDRIELNQILMLVKRCSVKEVILSEIHLVSAKIDSLINPTS